MKRFTADLHFDRKGKFTFERGFNHRLEMSEFLLDRLNSTVGVRDELYIVGDYTHEDDPVYWRNRIRCRNVRVVVGNHDASVTKLKAAVGESNVRERMFIKVRGQYTVLDHYPGAFWDQSHNGSMLLYGHTHRRREQTLDWIWPDRRSMDIGVDNAFDLLGDWRPFTEDEVYERLMVRPGHDPVSWYAENWGPFKKD